MITVFVDTNVLLDALFSREPFDAAAWELFSYGVEGKLSIKVSALSVVNAIYISKKYNVSLVDVKKGLKNFGKYIEYVDLLGQDVFDMLSEDWDDFEDSVQYVSAKNIEADYIVSRNSGDFEENDIPVVTADEFLSNHLDFNH